MRHRMSTAETRSAFLDAFRVLAYIAHGIGGLLCLLLFWCLHSFRDAPALPSLLSNHVSARGGREFLQTRISSLLMPLHSSNISEGKTVLCFSTAPHYWMVKAGAARQGKHQGSKKCTDKPSKHADKQFLSLEPIAEIVRFFLSPLSIISAVSASQYRRKT